MGICRLCGLPLDPSLAGRITFDRPVDMCRHCWTAWKDTLAGRWWILKREWLRMKQSFEDTIRRLQG